MTFVFPKMPSNARRPKISRPFAERETSSVSSFHDSPDDAFPSGDGGALAAAAIHGNIPMSSSKFEDSIHSIQTPPSGGGGGAVSKRTGRNNVGRKELQQEKRSSPSSLITAGLQQRHYENNHNNSGGRSTRTGHLRRINKPGSSLLGDIDKQNRQKLHQQRRNQQNRSSHSLILVSKYQEKFRNAGGGNSSVLWGAGTILSSKNQRKNNLENTAPVEPWEVSRDDSTQTFSTRFTAPTGTDDDDDDDDSDIEACEEDPRQHRHSTSSSRGSSRTLYSATESNRTVRSGVAMEVETSNASLGGTCTATALTVDDDDDEPKTQLHSTSKESSRMTVYSATESDRTICSRQFQQSSARRPHDTTSPVSEGTCTDTAIRLDDDDDDLIHLSNAYPRRHCEESPGGTCTQDALQVDNSDGHPWVQEVSSCNFSGDTILRLSINESRPDLHGGDDDDNDAVQAPSSSVCEKSHEYYVDSGILQPPYPNRHEKEFENEKLETKQLEPRHQYKAIVGSQQPYPDRQEKEFENKKLETMPLEPRLHYEAIVESQSPFSRGSRESATLGKPQVDFGTPPTPPWNDPVVDRGILATVESPPERSPVAAGSAAPLEPPPRVVDKERNVALTAADEESTNSTLHFTKRNVKKKSNTGAGGRKRNGKKKSSLIVPGRALGIDPHNSDPIEEYHSSQHSISSNPYTGGRKRRRPSDSEDDYWNENGSQQPQGRQKKRAYGGQPVAKKRRSSALDPKLFHGKNQQLLTPFISRRRTRSSAKKEREKAAQIEIDLCSESEPECKSTHAA